VRARAYIHIDAYMPRSPASQLVGCGLRERLDEMGC